MVDNLIKLDGDILLFIQENIRNTVLDKILVPFTGLNNVGILAILTVIAFLLIKKLRKTGLLMAVSLLMEFVIVNLMIKNFVARTRPYELVEGLNLLVGRASDFSFPSGHTGSAFAVAMVIFLTMSKRYGISALALAGLMGFSRLYVGIHYPSDVLAAALIGIGTAILTVKFVSVKLNIKRG